MRFDKMLRTATRTLVGACLIWAVCLGSVLHAQEPPKKEDKPTDWERLIYLPYKNFTSVLDQEKSAVFLPYGQFLKLWRNAKPEVMNTQTPVQSVITQATYTGKIENNLARIEATLKVKVLDKPWARVPLKFGDAAVGNLTAENDQILLIGTGEGTYDLLLPTVGEHTVKLELITRVHSSTEGKSFDLEIPLVGISNLELTIPSPDQTVDVIPHLVSAPLEGDANSTKISANVGSTNKITARWFPRVSKTPEMELLTSVTNQIHARVADGLVQTEAVLTYQVLRGELNQVVISIPLGHRILDVTAPNLKGWKSANEANRQVITIDLLGSGAKTIPVEIRTERPATGDVLELGGIEEDGAVKGIHAVGAVRESGIIVAGHGPEIALAVEQQRGLIRIEAGEVPEGLRRPENLYFKFYNPKFSLGVSAKPVEPRVTVNHATIMEFHDDELKLYANLDYTVERAGVFELKFAVPEGVKIDSVDCEQKQEFTVTPDGKTLTLTLNQKTQGNIKVAIAGHLSFTADQKQQSLNLKLPLLEPQTVAREQGTLQVYAPEAIEVITDEKGLVAVQPDRAAAGQARGNLRLASAWTFNRRPVEVPVTTVRKPTRLTAQMGTTLNVNREIVEVVSQLTYNVQYAGIDTFRISVPAAISDTVQIDPVTASGSVPVKQKSAAEAKDGWVTWTIITQREVVENQTFRIKYDLKLVKRNQTANITVQPVRPLGVPGMGDEERVPVTNLLGEIVVNKDRIWSLAATPKDLQTIDVRELTLLPAEGALAYRYSRPAVDLQLTATEHEIQEVVQTVISRALVEVVQTEDETVTFRCRFQLKTSERQRLQLELPGKVQPLGVMVAGKQVSLERSPQASATPGMEMYYVNVARAGRSDEPFGITLVYRLTGEKLPETGFGGRLKFAIPQLGATSNKQAVAVQQLRVVVWVPEQITLVGTPTHFTPEYRVGFWDALRGVSTWSKSPDVDSWIGDAGSGLFEFPTAGRAFVYNNLGGTDSLEVSWWRTSWTAWAFSLALVLVAFVLRGTSWENKLGMILLGAFAASLYALSDPDLTMYIVRSSRYGLGLLLAVWLIHLLLQKRTDTPPPLPADPITSIAAVSPPPGAFDEKPKPEKPEEPK